MKFSEPRKQLVEQRYFFLNTQESYVSLYIIEETVLYKKKTLYLLWEGE